MVKKKKADHLKTGLGPNNKNILKNSLKSCQIFKLLKYIRLHSYETVLMNISRLPINKLAKPKHQQDIFSGISDKNGRFKIFGLFQEISQI